jgi:hypothetical protein
LATGLEPANLARYAAKGGIGKCVAQCDCIAECSNDLMFFKGVLLDLDTSFVSYLLQDDITVLLHIPDQENIFLVCILVDVDSGTFF